MSLLLEALKRAEKAKEEAQRRAQEAAADSRLEPRLADEPAPHAEPRNVLTRDKLPDISQPLEILSDDLAHTAPASEREIGSVQQDGARATPERGPAIRAAASATRKSERATARRVFEAKMREPNPRLPFYATLAALGVFALGTVVYFWYQLRPPPPLAYTQPVRPADEQPTRIAEASPAGAVAHAAVEPAVRALPSKPAPPPRNEAAARAKPVASSPQRVSAPRPARSTARAAPPPAAAREAATPSNPPAREEPLSSPVATRTAPAHRVHPQVEAGYAAYQAGELGRAREAYGRALRDEPTNRDALLGLAAVEVRSQRPEIAEALYTRLLQSDPRDAYAQAGMLALRGAPQDAVLAESRLKSLLAADSGASALNFSLGNQYARQERWAEAQQAYFRAYTSDPENPDFAYNLAVSLDRLYKPRIALEYYERALALAEKRGASFERAAVQKRVQELAR